MKKGNAVLVIIIIILLIFITGSAIYFFSKKSSKQTSDQISTTSVEKKIENTHFGGGGMESTNLEATAELGVHFKRIAGDISTEKGIDLDQWDKQIKAAQEKDIWLLAVITPRSNSKEEWLTIEQFTQELKEVIERYDGDGQNDMPGLKYPIRYYEICNEIDLGETKGVQIAVNKPVAPAGPPPGGAPGDTNAGIGGLWTGFSFDDYLNLFNASYNVLTNVCSDCQLSPGSFVDGKLSSAFTYLLENGAKDKIGFISYHSYQEYLDTDKLMSSLSQIGLSDIPIILTESQFGGMQQKEPYNQDDLAKIQTRSYVYALAKGINKLMPSEFKVASQFPEGLKWSCMIDQNGKKRPSFYAYQTLIKKLDFFTEVEELDKYQYKFTVDDQSVYVLWGEGSVPSKIKGTVKLTSIDGQEKEIQSSEIKLSDSPIFVEIK